MSRRVLNIIFLVSVIVTLAFAMAVFMTGCGDFQSSCSTPDMATPDMDTPTCKPCTQSPSQGCGEGEVCTAFTGSLCCHGK